LLHLGLNAIAAPQLKIVLTRILKVAAICLRTPIDLTPNGIGSTTELGMEKLFDAKDKVYLPNLITLYAAIFLIGGLCAIPTILYVLLFLAMMIYGAPEL
jgi:hypothetical protein